MPSSRSGVIAVAFIFFVTVCGFVAAALNSVLPLAIGIIAGLLFYVWRWHIAALQVISSEDVASARKESNVAFFIFVLSWFIR